MGPPAPSAANAGKRLNYDRVTAGTNVAPRGRSHSEGLPPENLSLAVLRGVWGGALSLVLVVVGMALFAFGAIVVIASVVKTVGKVELSTRIGAVVVSIGGLALLAGGVRTITRVRPWVVRRSPGARCPRSPHCSPRAIWGGQGGIYASGGGGDGAGGGDGGGC